MTTPEGETLSDRVRSALEPGDGDRCRDHRHRVLSCVWLQHRRGVPHRAGSRSDCHLRQGDALRSAHREETPSGATRYRPRASIAPPGNRTASIESLRAGSPRGSLSATSATTRRAPTIRTTSSPHEHRRELRAARVFGAWLNHDDSRGVNSLDMLVKRERPLVHQALHVRLRVDPRAAGPSTPSVIGPATNTSSN